ncbi:MAG TPA: type II toxin-antitoxin system mRNA interferase toxin, RelE/StbE family [Polyangiaceae bacterium]|jgi:addiction module RelE/StbE family toxin
MWTILEHKGLAKEIASAPLQVREKYEFWKNVVRLSGPEGLRNVQGFHDEALAGKWAGFRSSRLSQAYRVIYQCNRELVTVTVERVSKHDYRK